LDHETHGLQSVDSSPGVPPPFVLPLASFRLCNKITLLPTA
jgi:hypothetical protein